MPQGEISNKPQHDKCSSQVYGPLSYKSADSLGKYGHALNKRELKGTRAGDEATKPNVRQYITATDWDLYISLALSLATSRTLQKGIVQRHNYVSKVSRRCPICSNAQLLSDNSVFCCKRTVSVSFWT